MKLYKMLIIICLVVAFSSNLELEAASNKTTYTYHPNKKVETRTVRNSKGIKLDYKRYTNKGKKIVDYDYCSGNNQVYKITTYTTAGKVKTVKRYKCKQSNLKVAQFNVLKPDDMTYGKGTSRLKRISGTISKAKADVVSLNEVYEGYQKTGIKNNTSYKIIQPKGKEPYGWTSAIAYNSKKVKLINSGAYFFKNQETYTSGSLKGKQASRTAVWAIFEKEGVRFIFISGQTQNDWFTNVRYKQIKEMQALGTRLSNKYGIKNVVYAGDFNADGYKNKNCTSPLPTYVGSKRKLSYDYICSSNGTNTRGTIIDSKASDHTLVYTSTTIKR